MHFKHKLIFGFRKEHALFQRLAETHHKGADSTAFKEFKKMMDKKFGKGKRGIDTFLSNDDMTLATFAASIDQEKALVVLRTLGADLCARDQNHLAPIHYASALGYRNIIEYLTDERIDINQRGKLGNTALHYASANLKLATVSKLISLGADVNIKNNHNKTPLDICRPYRKYDANVEKIAQLLESAALDGSNFPAKESQGRNDRVKLEIMTKQVKEEVLEVVDTKLKRTEELIDKTKDEFQEKHNQIEQRVEQVDEEVKTSYKQLADNNDKYNEKIDKLTELTQNMKSVIGTYNYGHQGMPPNQRQSAELYYSIPDSGPFMARPAPRPLSQIPPTPVFHLGPRQSVPMGREDRYEEIQNIPELPRQLSNPEQHYYDVQPYSWHPNQFPTGGFHKSRTEPGAIVRNQSANLHSRLPTKIKQQKFTVFMKP